MKKVLLPLLLISATLAAGFFFDRQAPPAVDQASPEFHDMRINPVADYVQLIDPDDAEILQLARRLGTPERAYRYVHDEIRFAPFVPPGPVAETLRHGVGSCLGKSAVLASLYRAMGMPATNVRMVMGIVMTPQGPADHVWLDLEHEGRCLQQDPSGMLGEFDFYAFPGNRYVDTYVVKESFVFNDNGFAVVSQLNRFRNGSATGE